MDISLSMVAIIFLTHWFTFTDNAIQQYNIRVSELSHDGHFLEELQLTIISSTVVKSLKGNMYVTVFDSQNTLFNSSKLTGSKIPTYSMKYNRLL